MAVGIDLNYFFSWPLVLFIFATLLQGPSQNSTPTWFYQERYSVGMRLWVTNYDLSNACHTLGRPIQAYPTTNPSKPNDQSKQTPTTNPSKPNDQSNDGQSNNGQSGQLPNQWRPTNPSKPNDQSNDGQSKRRPIQTTANPTTANPTTAHPRASVRGKILCTDSLSSHHSSALLPLYMDLIVVPHDASTPQLLMGAMQSPSTSADAYYNLASQLLDAMQPRINFHDATRYCTQQLYQKAQRPRVSMILIFLFICFRCDDGRWSYRHRKFTHYHRTFSVELEHRVRAIGVWLI